MTVEAHGPGGRTIEAAGRPSAKGGGEAYEVYRAFLLAANRFSKSELRTAYARPRLTIIQSIRKKTVTTLLAEDVALRIANALAAAQEPDRLGLISRMRQFAASVERGAESREAVIQKNGTEIACSLLEVCGAVLEPGPTCSLANLPMLLHCGLDP